MLGWVFYPFYLKKGVYTMPEFIKIRYGLKCQKYIAWLSMFLYMPRIATTLISGGLVLEVILGWNLWVSIFSLLFVTTLYVILGGMNAIVYTEILQTGVLIGGSVILFALALDKVGGWDALQDELPPYYFTTFRSDSEAPYPWYGVVFGYPLQAMWFHVFDQEMVQRVLIAKDDVQAKGGCVLGGALKFVPPLCFCIPGMISYVLYPTLLGSNCSPDNRDDCEWDKAYPALVVEVLPNGLMGLILAAMLAALMSTLASNFNSFATVFTMDIYRIMRPDIDEGDSKLVWVGRAAALAMTLVSVAFIPCIYLLSDTIYQGNLLLLPHPPHPTPPSHLLRQFVFTNCLLTGAAG
jgi:SSS family solute:Na+ symporter